MNDPRVHALRSLLAAYETREVYGEDHAGCGASMQRCAEAMTALNGKSGATVTIALIDGGVLIDGTLVTDRWAASAPLLVRMRERGVQGVRLSAGITIDDLQWLFVAATNHGSTVSPSRRVIVGAVSATGDESRVGQPSLASEPASLLPVSPRAATASNALVDPLRESWSALISRAGGPQDARIAALASRIIAAAVHNRQSIVPLIDLKSYDEYTFVHVSNVALLASALAEAVGIAGGALQQLTEAALLHDVGKWTIPKRVLAKAGDLTDDERAQVRRHPAIGAALLAGSRGVSDLAIIIAYEHHLRIDGKGYPDTGRVRRPSVPSQIVQIADIFDALRSNRPYRAGMPLDQCLAVMDKEAGNAFDRSLYQVFCDRILSRVRDRGNPCIAGQVHDEPAPAAAA